MLSYSGHDATITKETRCLPSESFRASTFMPAVS